MKLNKIHQDLKEVYKGKETDLILGFEFGYEDEIMRAMTIFRSGFWSVAPFAFDDYSDYAIRLMPNKELFDAPIVTKGISDFRTISPDLASFITMSWLPFLKDIDIINDELKKNWETFEELSLPFRQYTNGLDSLDYLKEYLHNEDNLKYLENPSEFYTKVYLDFWNHYYDTPQQKEYVALMSSMIENESYLPDFRIKDYGIWNTRAYHALAQRAYPKIDYKNVVDFENYNFQSGMQPHGFDPVGIGFEIQPQATSTSFELGSILTFFDTNPHLEWEYSKAIKEHPLFELLVSIKKNKNSYNGDAHIEVAKVIDEQLNDPIMAWDALVSAGYWSGENFNEPNIKAWKAAIDLSEKHGWKAINEVLMDQLEFYNHYKDKI